jgi:hypothetical protein
METVFYAVEIKKIAAAAAFHNRGNREFPARVTRG